MRLINAETLRAEFTGNFNELWHYTGVWAMIDCAPTVDAVPVVRCGQCKHWKINPNNLYGGYCRYCESAKIDHFCSYGERKAQI